MLDLDTTGQFKRDYKREKAGRHADLDEIFAAVTNLLINKQPLPAANNAGETELAATATVGNGATGISSSSSSSGQADHCPRRKRSS